VYPLSVYAHPVSSFVAPVVPPDSDPDEGSQVVVCFSADWLPFLLGAAKQLLLQSTWQGDATVQQLAMDRANDLITILGSNASVCPEIMVIRNIRYDVETDTIETDFGQTGDWTPNPTFDPRSNPDYQVPALTGDNAQCRAAAGMVASIKGFVDAGIRYTEVAGMTGAIIDFLLLFIPEAGIFIALIVGAVEALITLGADALNDNFNDTTYDMLRCEFYCHLNSDGTMNGTQFNSIVSQIQSEQSVFVYDVCLLWFAMTGFVGMVNAGVENAVDADCSGCDCGWCRFVELTTDCPSDFNLVRGNCDGGNGVTGIFIDTNNKSDVYAEITLGTTYRFTHISMTFSAAFAGSNGSAVIQGYLAGSQVFSSVSAGDGTHVTFAWDGDEIIDYFNVQVNSGTDGTPAHLEHVQIQGKETEPTILNAC
jgi:hypothetical protein